MFKQLLLASGLFWIFNAWSVQVYFTPSPDCENHIIEKIKAAKTSIDIAVYSIGNEKIVAALEEARKTNPKLMIRILTDKVQAFGRGSLVSRLAEDKFIIRVHTKHKIMHNKFAIFDAGTPGASAVNGSFNWTEAASNSNDENCLFMSSLESPSEKVAVVSYKNMFESLWAQNTQEKSDPYIVRILAKKDEKAQQSTSKGSNSSKQGSEPEPSDESHE
jgi:phosphatidylserine/phosphatidylglycerophosphate/cardiolipin synthase-like enzyme